VLIAICVANLAACTSAPRFTKSPPVEPSRPTATTPPPVEDVAPTSGNTDSAATPGARGNEVVERAEEYLGAPYRSGGTSTNGVDCSGLTYSVYRSVGVNLPRSSDEQVRVGEPVAREALAPGDLIFFGSTSNVSHVGIYAGDGEFIHASTRARSVRFDRLDTTYFRDRYLTARRVL
jgi:murein DD-endopeptidase